jgi:hypothetical protein
VPKKLRRWWVPIVLVAVAVLALCVVAGIEAQGVMFLVPPLALGLALALKDGPVERVLRHWVRFRCKHAPRTVARIGDPHGFVPVPRGTLLMGCSLAVRPPPMCALAGSR